ncbi:aconitate hydratase AcnA [Bordetella petrii]|uniref:Aconitate hydratase n=1 Tax=Bordetella petrii TaxID=94624 RepID=A0ABT7W387_9BORD|nr:aconitate hydratase AcnA [Bordetella petrii]MDM9559663.1 aconitate hydratase AcnA [Bordetella petrii]
MTASLVLNGVPAAYIDVAHVAGRYGVDIDTLPYVIRILLENLERHRHFGRPVQDAEIGAVAQWQSNISAQISLHVERVILPDSSGLPVLQDLAALRDAVAAAGGDPAAVDARVPVDLIVDHSLQVDAWGEDGALRRNLDAEFGRNAERYRFLKWAQQAFGGLRVFPPGTGIIHQVNLEKLATVVTLREHAGRQWAYPDFVIGGDSHTPMINGLGVLGWGVGGIDAESALLGRAYTFPIPEVVGVELKGAFRGPATTTDAALLVTQCLRREGVTGCMVEFFGEAVPRLSVADRATLANMAPEYGATCGFFPVDEQTLRYLRMTGRDDAHIESVAAYCKANRLWRADPLSSSIRYARTVTIDLDRAEPCMSGPRRPQDRLPISELSGDFVQRLSRPPADGGFGVAPDALARPAGGAGLRHGSIVLAAITSCTNTSNPSVMLAAGLLARRARQRGLVPPQWVKRSLAPGSRTVTDYLRNTGLLDDLAAIGFAVVGYGCTTCGGKSGPLSPDVVRDLVEHEWVACAVLSGNRNFEGRIHKLVRANYIGSPPLVVAYALAGRIDIDFARDPIGHDSQGQPVWLHELWPDEAELGALMRAALSADGFRRVWDLEPEGAPQWSQLVAGTGRHWQWDPDSTYLVEPPFFQPPAPSAQQSGQRLRAARVLGLYGDSLTTDHISPSGEIPVEAPAGQYLLSRGVAQPDFNTYVARRCNFEVMTRATFGNIRIRNLLAPDTEGGYTRHFPSGEVMSIYDASRRYIAQGTATVVLAGKEYGTGSSRDWAAKGTALLGVRAVLAKSFERIHRANLVGMGVLPLQFEAGQGWQELGLNGSEEFDFHDVVDAVQQGRALRVTATRADARIEFVVQPQVLTRSERELLLQGGIPASVLADYLRN